MLGLIALPDADALGANPGTNGRIAYHSFNQTTRDHEVWIADADGSNTHFLGLGASTSWSPDGTKLAVDNRVVDPDTAAVLAVLPGSRATWSPDGGRLAVAATPPGGTGSEVYVVDVDGTNSTRITFNDAYDDAPSWSPDGARIAFQSNRDGVAHLYTMKP